MKQDTIEKKEIPSWNEIREFMYETSRMMREAVERSQVEYDKRQVERAKRQAEYDKRQAEYDKRQAEYDKRQAEYDKRQAEEHTKRQAEYEKSRAEYKKWQAEYDKRQAEYQAAHEKSRAEYEVRQAKAEKQMEELRQQMKETDRKLKEEATRYSSLTGHVVEGLMEPSALALFQQAGFDISKCWKNMKGKRKDLNIGMEVDLFLHDTTDAVAVEVKTNCTKGDVDYFLKQMEKFGDVFQSYADTNVYLAMAAINYDYEADKYAAEKGMFVIRVCEDAFSLDPAKKEDMAYFYKGKCHGGH